MSSRNLFSRLVNSPFLSVESSSHKNRLLKLILRLAFGILGTIVLVIGVLFAPSSQANMVVGDSNAKITVKVFSSLTCPHCANFHKKIFEELNTEFIEKKLVKFEHHAFPLDLAALNAEKLLRCTSEPARRFDLLKIIYDKQIGRAHV